MAMNLRVPSDQSRAGLLYFDTQGTSNAGVQGLSFATFVLGDVNQFQRYVSTSTNAARAPKTLVSSTARTPGASAPNSP